MTRISLDDIDALSAEPVTPPVAGEIVISDSDAEQRLARALQEASQPKSERTAAPTQSRTVLKPTLEENEEKNGYEFRFPGPVSKQLSTQLSLNGWKFYSMGWKDPKWCIKRSPGARIFACTLVKILLGENKLKPIESATS